MALYSILTRVLSSDATRPDVDKELIVFTSQTHISNESNLKRTLDEFKSNGITVKFGINGEPSKRLYEFLTDGRMNDEVIVNTDHQQFQLFIKLVSPSVRLPSKFITDLKINAFLFHYFNTIRKSLSYRKSSKIAKLKIDKNHTKIHKNRNRRRFFCRVPG